MRTSFIRWVGGGVYKKLVDAAMFLFSFVMCVCVCVFFFSNNNKKGGAQGKKKKKFWNGSWKEKNGVSGREFKNFERNCFSFSALSKSLSRHSHVI